MATSDAQLLGTMLQYAQPATLPTIRRSQYLADALESLQETGADNLRTPTALWGKLAGQALLQGARDKNFQQLSNQLMGDQRGVMDALMQGMPGYEASPQAAAIGDALSPAPPEPSAAAMLQPQRGEYPRASFAPPQQAPQPIAQPAPQPGAIPTQAILPQEIEMIERYKNSPYPQVRAKAMELAADIQKRRVTPIDPSKPQFMQDGSVRNLGAEVTTTPGPKPGTEIQTTNATGEKKLFDSELMGKTEPGAAYDPTTGAFRKIPTTVGGRVMPFGAMGPEQAQGAVSKISNGKQMVNYTTLRSKAASALEPEGAENNATDLNLIDVANTALANNPDLAVSEGFFKTVKEAQGGLAGLISQLKNDVSQKGLLDQTYRDRLKKIIAASLHHRYEAAKQEAEMMRPGLDLIGLGDQVDEVLATLAPPIEYHPAPARPPAGVRQPPPPKGGVPRPRTPAEAMALPPGTPFIDPEGVPRIRP